MRSDRKRRQGGGDRERRAAHPRPEASCGSRQGHAATFAKTTINHLYSVVSGRARVKIEGGSNEGLAVGDVITVPCWHAHALEAEEDAVVFQVTDAPLLEKVGLVKTA